MKGTNYNWVNTSNSSFFEYIIDHSWLNDSFVFKYSDRYYLFIFDIDDNSYKILDEEFDGNWRYFQSEKFFKEDLKELFENDYKYTITLDNQVFNIISDIIIAFLKKRINI